MTFPPLSLDGLRPNPEWAKLPIFDRRGWKRVRFGDVVRQLKEEVDPQKGQVERYVAGEHMETENVHIRKWGTVGDGYLGPAFIRRFRKGQVLYGSRRTYLKKVAVAEWDGVTANTTFVLEAVKEKLLSELLPWLMLSERFTTHSIQQSKGSTNPYINFPDLAKFDFELPPLDQQRRIAKILWAVDESLRTSDGLIDALQECRQSLLDSIAHAYSSSHGLASLDSVVEPGRPICYGILMPGLGVADGIPVIRVRDFPDGYIHEEHLLLTTPEIEEPFKRSRLRHGDLLISIRGSIGRLAEVPASLEEANVTQDTARLSISQEHNRDYVRALLESRFVQNQISSRITGLAVKGINIGELRKLQIPLPPRPKQDAIAEQLGVIAKTNSAVSSRSRIERTLMAFALESLL
jgi:type I restriction enzyme, S subunit